MHDHDCDYETGDVSFGKMLTKESYVKYTNSLILVQGNMGRIKEVSVVVEENLPGSDVIQT